MASSNQTQTYKLAQWLEDDPVLREDFNADNFKIETALKSLQTAINENKSVVGQYTGTGFTSTQSISVGFRPRIVMVVTYGDANGANVMVALATGTSDPKYLTITPNGFQVTGYQNSTDTQVSGVNLYRYVAFRA